MVHSQLSPEAMRTLGLSEDLPQQVLNVVKEDLKNPSLLKHLMHSFNHKKNPNLMTMSEAELKTMQDEMKKNSRHLKRQSKQLKKNQEIWKYWMRPLMWLNLQPRV